MCFDKSEKERLFHAIRDHEKMIGALKEAQTVNATNFKIMDNTIQTSKSWVNVLVSFIVAAGLIFAAGITWYLNVHLEQDADRDEVLQELRETLSDLNSTISSVEAGLEYNQLRIEEHQIPENHPNNTSNFLYLEREFESFRDQYRIDIDRIEQLIRQGFSNGESNG